MCDVWHDDLMLESLDLTLMKRLCSLMLSSIPFAIICSRLVCVLL